MERADIEESKRSIALNAPDPQASYPCGNFSDTSSRKSKRVGKYCIPHTANKHHKVNKVVVFITKRKH